MNEPAAIWIAAGFAVAGLVMMCIPAKILLALDPRKGRRIYNRVLETTGDEKRAMMTVTIFYKLFGVVFLIPGAILLLWRLAVALGD